MVVSNDTVDKYLKKTAHEIAKKKTKNTKIAADDEAVLAISADLEKLLIETDPKVKQVVSFIVIFTLGI